MTATATTTPALSSLLLASVPAAAGATPSAAGGPAAAGGPGAAQTAGFQALLLGLRGSPTTPAAPATQPGAAVTVPVDGTGSLLPTALQAPSAADATAPVAGLPAASPGPGAGEDLPADGTTLPPPDATTPLAALESAAPAPAVAPAPAPPAPPPAATPAAPGPEAGAPAAILAATGRQAVAAPSARSSGASDGPQPAGSDAATDAATDALPTDAPAGDATAPAADATTSLAEFRARLAALLAPVDRPPLLADAAPSGTAVAATGPVASTGATGPAASLAAAVADPLLDNLPILKPLGDADAWSQGVGERVLMMAERGLQSATIKLQPEHLGPMEIRIQVDEDGAAQVNFSAQHAQTRDALETAIPRLRELLAEQGLSLSQANVDAGGRGGFAQRAFGNEPPPWLRWGGGAEAEVETLTWRGGRSSERRLDVLV